MFVCISCGATFSKQFGKCNICQTWNCIVEKEVVEKNEFIRHRSKKGQSKHNEKTKTYQIIDDKALSEDRFYCWGCDGNCGALSHSHLIPGHELVATQKNILLMGCCS